MVSSALGLKKNMIPPLLTDAVVARLTSSYMDNMRDNYTNEDDKILSKGFEDQTHNVLEHLQDDIVKELFLSFLCN